MHGAAMTRKELPATDERLAKLTRDEIDIGVDARGRPTILTIKDTPIDRMMQRGKLANVQYLAAVRYRRHWHLAGMAPHVNSVDLNRIYAADFGSFGHMAKTESQADHRKAYREARAAIGEMPAIVLEQVLCHETTLEKLGIEFRHRSRRKAALAAEDYIVAVLDDLVKHWDIKEQEEGRIRKWRT